jgi:phospholipid/cholesterol/gamma-HCH transport system substrate-binding protein
MRRALVIGFAVVAVAAAGIFAIGASDPKGTTYKIELDNAFGLVKGADFKVGGVPVGAISDLDVTPDARALVEVEVSKGGEGFGGLRQSAECEVAPQSLIGEYFIDCQPGTDGPLLKSGATVPVDHTTSPIPPDLVLNIMRRPVAERFSIIFSELGVGFAARGDDVNETIRRAIPALGATSDVLELLASRRQTLADLSRESGQVLKVLGERREDVTDFVKATADAASATAERRADVAETFRRFPGFLDQLTPTMADLGVASRQLAPTLADLRVAAPEVTRLLDTLRPFAEASEPAVVSLGDTSRAGLTASREASSLIDRLGELGQASPEPGKNLRIILDHLADRDFAVEGDPDSPGGKGYTGLEAPLQYIFDQSLAANIFDQRGYSLKINLTTGRCSDYTDAEEAKSDPEKYAACNQNLGPNQPGITTPDPGPGAAERSTRTTRSTRTDDATQPSSSPEAPSSSPPATATVPPLPSTPADKLPAVKPVQDLLNKIPELVNPVTGKLRDGIDKTREDVRKALERAKQQAQQQTQPVAPANDLLDFLLSP